jgi:hypothetical protein
MTEERNYIRIILTAKDARKFVMEEVEFMMVNYIAFPTTRNC